MAKNESRHFKLEVPLDASGIEDFTPEKDVKVVARDSGGRFYSETLSLDKQGRGRATLSFPENPGSLRVYVGPSDASDEELTGLQTISVSVSGRQWTDERKLKLAPVVIHSYYWHWWLFWCRTFTVRGRVTCPDGSPVPGAKVCAYDVDCWWWWCSRQLVGCDTTDATGAFEIRFRFCCGWWPWWWWRLRVWQLEPVLVDRILQVLQRDPTVRRLPDPSPRPSLAVFDQFLADEGPVRDSLTATVDPAELPALRKRLLPRLSKAPEFEQLRIWPWWPWFPWWDCTPDLVFQVSQNCHGQETIIVDEGFGDTRWNIPNNLNVTLVADDEACCTGHPDDPEGDCLVIDSVCGDLIAGIGGNPPGAPGVATPTDGFRNPGLPATTGDRPYAGNSPLYGRFGLGATVDYYEFEWSDDDGLSWNSMPPAAAGGFTRLYFGPKLGTADPPDWHSVPFHFNIIDGHNVVESRQHFEANNEPASWGITRFWWSQTLDLLMVWKTAGIFADGRYRLRLKSWELTGVNLDKNEVLPLCNTEDANGLVLTIDNRVVTAGPTDAHGHVCAAGTVHTCTSEPDTDIISVKIIHADGTDTDVAACGNVAVTDDDDLQVDFVAHDPDGHLAQYTLDVTFGVNQINELLTLGGTLSASPVPVSWAPPAAQVGPTYGLARALQGAVAPIWHGGALRLRVKATDAFPETCCYQLELRAHKRTIVNCDHSFRGQQNYSEYSFMIQV